MARPAAPFVPDPAAARRRLLGERGETIAARHLTRCGMVLLDRNWRCEAGEIDLVLRDGHVLVICEVKTRTSIDYGAPLEAASLTAGDADVEAITARIRAAVQAQIAHVTSASTRS